MAVPEAEGGLRLGTENIQREEPESQDGAKESEGTVRCWQRTPLDTRVQDAQEMMRFSVETL